MDWFKWMIEHINALICCTTEIQFWSQVQSFVCARFCFGRGEKRKLLLQLQGLLADVSSDKKADELSVLVDECTEIQIYWENMKVRLCCVPGHWTKLYPHKLVLQKVVDDPRDHSSGNTSSELSLRFPALHGELVIGLRSWLWNLIASDQEK